MADPLTLLAVAATFLLAGTVKGVIGLGLPTVSLAILTVAFGLQPAMALLLVPSLITNAWQAAAGGHAKVIGARIWPFLLAAAATVWIGAGILVRADVRLLAALLGALLFAYAAFGLYGLALRMPRRWEGWAGAVLGAINGVLTGMTGSFVVPGVLYLQALQLPKDLLVQAMGMLFTVSTLALALALADHRLLGSESLTASSIAVVPALLGVALGRRVRRSLSEARFRQVFFVALLLLGAYIVARSLG